MAYKPAVASDDQGPVLINGYDTSHNVEPYGFGGSDEDGFYDQRDDMVGGTDTPWSAQWRSYSDNAPVEDAAPWSTSGVLSQSDLAS